MKSINIIIPYFGRLPNYFQLWLESVRYNPTIDFTLLTDDKSEWDYPQNVHVVYSTFTDIQQRVHIKLSNNCNIDKPYKLCDYKPAYGYLFSDIIGDYDFWGFCDVDLIFGNIRRFVTEVIMEQYSRVFSLGHLTLIRNERKYNEAFMQKVDGCLYYEDVFSTEASCYFDECFRPGTSTDIWKSIFPDEMYENKNVIDDILIPLPHCRLNFVEANHPQKSTGLYFLYDKGKLQRCYLMGNRSIKEESLYVHLQKRPMQICTNIYDKFVIIPDRFIPYKVSLSVIEQRFYTRKRIFQQYWNRLKHKIMNV